MSTARPRASSPSRARILARVADEVLAGGTGDVSLSALGRRVGSNNRMLLYYFGSREGLLDEASLEALARFPRLHGMIDRLAQDGPLAERLERAWCDIAAPENAPFLTLFFERFALALHHPERNEVFFQRVGGDWTARLREVLEREGLDAEQALLHATAVVALWRGLQVSLLSGEPAHALHAAYLTCVRALTARPRGG